MLVTPQSSVSTMAPGTMPLTTLDEEMNGWMDKFIK